MSRTLDAALEAMLAGDNAKVCLLVKLRMNDGTYYRINSSANSVFWNEGSGDEEYVGAGKLGSISGADEGTELQTYAIDLVLSGIPSEYVVDSLNTDYKNQPAIIYLAALDVDNSVLFTSSEEDGPVELFVGRMDNMIIALEETATISITTTNRLSDWERPRGGKFNDHSQKLYYAKLKPAGITNFDNQDLGFEYVDSLKDKEITWGAGHVALRGSGGGGGGSRGGDGPPVRVP